MEYQSFFSVLTQVDKKYLNSMDVFKNLAQELDKLSKESKLDLLKKSKSDIIVIDSSFLEESKLFAFFKLGWLLAMRVRDNADSPTTYKVFSLELKETTVYWIDRDPMILAKRISNLLFGIES